MKKPTNSVQTIGWREWASLPELGIPKIKVKVDTGATTTSIHAYDLKYVRRDGIRFVKFKVHPFQSNTKETVTTEAELIKMINVKSSNGMPEKRPLIETKIKLGNRKWKTRITLAKRSTMSFRMLLGRNSIKNKFLVDVSKSYLLKENDE